MLFIRRVCGDCFNMDPSHNQGEKTFCALISCLIMTQEQEPATPIVRSSLPSFCGILPLGPMNSSPIVPQQQQRG